MPAGVTWSAYMKGLTACALAVAAGSQTVHLIYQPLKDMDELVEKEKERILKFEKAEKEKISQSGDLKSKS